MAFLQLSRYSIAPCSRLPVANARFRSSGHRNFGLDEREEREQGNAVTVGWKKGLRFGAPEGKAEKEEAEKAIKEVGASLAPGEPLEVM